MSVAATLRSVRRDPLAAGRFLEPAALVTLFVVLPLESVLVIPTQVLVPPYIVVLPVLSLIALVATGSLRAFLPGRALTIALLVWVGVTTLSLVMWIVDRPPRIALASGYGSLRASVLRGPMQLAITLTFLAALPLTLALARRRLGPAVAWFVGVAALTALFGIWQVVANRLGMPIQNISNDPLVTGRATPGWRGLLRAYSTFGEPSPFAAYLLGPLALAIAVAVWPPSRRVRIAATAAAAVIFSAFLLTLSTGAWAAFPFVGLFGLAALLHRRAWWGIVVVPLGLVAVTILTFGPLLALNARDTNHGSQQSASRQDAASVSGGISSIPSVFGRRIGESLSSGERGARSVIQRYQVTLWEEHPLLGVGIGAADLYTARALHQHSLPSTYGVWPGVLAETGTLGTLSLLAVVVVFVVQSVTALRRSPHSPWYPVVAGALAGVIGELAAYLWFYERFPAHLWGLLGLGVLASRRLRSSTT